MREARPVLIDLDCALLCGLVAFKVSDRHIAVGSAEARREQGCRHIVKPLAKRAGGKHLQHPVKLGRQELVRVIAPLPQRLHLVSGHAEEEHVLVTDPIADLDVRAVERAEGDRAIQEIGHILSGALVANSVAIRMSGDEFMVLIRHGSEELLDEICTAIEQRVQHYNATAPAGSFQLSFSTGVAKYEGGSVEKFLVELDQRMYAEKRAFHAARDGHAAPEQGNAPSI